MTARARRRAAAGFTLLEVLIAMAIMTVMFASILSVQSGSINAANRARTMNTVAMLARRKVTETELAVQNKQFDEVKEEEEGAFDAPFADYRWKSEVKKLEFPQLRLGVAAPGQDDPAGGGGSTGQTDVQEIIAKALAKYLTESVRELRVTILWKVEKVDRTFTVTSYWVDLTRALSF